MALRHGLRRVVGSRLQTPTFQSSFLSSRFQSSSLLASRFFATQKAQVVDPVQDFKSLKTRLFEDIDTEIDDVHKVDRKEEIDKQLKAVGGTLTTEVEDNAKTFIIRLSKNNYDVEVKWNPQDTSEEDETDQPDMGMGGEEEGKQDNPEEDQQQQAGPPAHNITIFVTPKGKTQRIRVGCIATRDFDLRVEGLDLSNEKGEFPEQETDESLYFNELSSDVQDGIYDLLHSLNIDDRTATLVHHQNQQADAERLTRNLKKFVNFLSL
jgi:hypothetical protein